MTLAKKLITAIALTTFAGCSAAPDAPGAPDTKGAGAEALIQLPPPDIDFDIPMNGLSSQALGMNLLAANYENSALFVAYPLNEVTFRAAGDGGVQRLHDALVHSGTREFLRYVIRGALTPSQRVTIVGAGWTIDERGVAGLCPAWSTSGIAGNEPCQQLVSGWVLAENNPRRRHVALSSRSADASGARRTLLASVGSVTLPDTASDAPDADDTLPSFRACAVYSASADCGWNLGSSRGVVGSCTPGDRVELGTGGAPVSDCTRTLGSSADDTVLRVCDGIRGCASSSAIAQNDDDGCGARRQSYVSFVCPSSGDFSVMLGHYNRAADVSASIAARTTPPGATSPVAGRTKYPIHEIELFTYAEGAFFGNIFRRDQLSVSWVWNGQGLVQDPNFQRGPNVPAGSVYAAMYACYEWPFSDDPIYQQSRVCATGLDAGCVARSLGRCTAMCTAMAGAPAGFGGYGQCSNNESFPWPVQTYLHRRDDIAPVVGIR